MPDRFQSDAAQTQAAYIVKNNIGFDAVFVKVTDLILMGSKRDQDDSRHCVALFLQSLLYPLGSRFLFVRTDVDKNLILNIVGDDAGRRHSRISALPSEGSLRGSRS